MIPLTSHRFDDWVKVYNEGRENLSGFVPLHTQELRLMIRNHHFRQEDMYIALQGTRPIAVARYSADSDSGISFVADLAFLPDMNSGIETLVEFLMKLARKNGSIGLTSWTFMAQVSIPDILSRFTFDTRRVRHEMFIDLNQTKVRGPLGTTEVRKCDEMKSLLELLPLNSRSDIRPFDIFELRDEISGDWRPRFLGLANAGAGHLMVASRSNNKRTEGRIDLTSLATSLTKQNDLLFEMTHDLVANLYRDGVRRVKLEMDAGFSLRQSLMHSGFEVRRTLLEMCLDILHD